MCQYAVWVGKEWRSQEFFNQPKLKFSGKLDKNGEFNLGNYLQKCLGPEINNIPKYEQYEQYSKIQMEVTIMAEKLPPHTTGDIAAGLWSPAPLPDDKPEVAQCE